MQPPEFLPTIVLALETQFCDKQCLTMSIDLFNPTLCASLKSELKQGTDVFEVVLDTGCSFAMTHDLNNFQSEPVFDDWGTVQTASTTLPLTAFVTIHWKVQTSAGESCILTVLGFYVPRSSVHLLYPQDYIRHHRMSTQIDQYGGNSKEFWMNLQDNKGALRSPIVSGSKLPILAARQIASSCTCHISSSFSLIFDAHHAHNVFNLQNQNLSSTQKQLLLTRTSRFSTSTISLLTSNPYCRIL
jgi:hypothetical protein